MEEIRAKGFDISKTTSIVISTSVGTTMTYTIGMDNLITEGMTPVVLPTLYEPFVEVVPDGEGFRVLVPNIGGKTIEKVRWWSISEMGISEKITTSPYIAKSAYQGCTGCRSIWADATISGIAYRSFLSFGVPYTAAPIPPASTYLPKPLADSDIFLDGIYTAKAYEDQVTASRQIRAGIDNALSLVTVQDTLRWTRGIIPYEIKSTVIAAEKTLVEQVLDEIYQSTGIAFVAPLSYSSRDGIDIPPTLAVKIIDTGDFGPEYTAAQKATLVAEAACSTNNLGKKATKVLLSRSRPSGCLGNIVPDPTSALGILRHEFYHILGAAHEIKSKFAPDNEIVTDVIYPWKLGQFYAGPNENLISQSGYDSNSIMRYDPYDFSICNETGYDGTTPKWDYSTVNKAAHDLMITNIGKLPVACQYNENAIFNSACYDACRTLRTAGPQKTDYSPLDKEYMRKFYKLNNAFREAMTQAGVTRTRTEAANILANIVTLVKEASTDLSKITPGSNHQLAVLTLGRLSTKAPSTFTLGCSTSPTDIISGRKSCSRSACWNVGSSGNIFLPGLEVKSQYVLHEGQCGYAFQDEATKVCMSVSARGGTANGTSGFVSCTLKINELGG
ncbi:MAG: M12 family metallopeptidase [Pseudobdellovibrionaceae bacterium]|nr:M12 family metallopeptidase [Pseudobdellovibrionaceae bacterium]